MVAVGRFLNVISPALEPISKSSTHYLARIISSKVVLASKPRYRWALDRLGLEYRY